MSKTATRPNTALIEAIETGRIIKVGNDKYRVPGVKGTFTEGTVMDQISRQHRSEHRHFGDARRDRRKKSRRR